MGRSATCIPCWPITASISPDHRIFNADLAGGPMMDLGSYLTSFALMVGGMPQEIVARGSAGGGA
jgi:predicted dehydrogenase